MRHPYGIAVDRRGRVYVVNPGASDVESFAPDGRQLARWGSRGEAPGQFDQPAGVAVDRHGTVYVADRYNDRIQRFSPDGRLLGLWGHRHGGPNRPDRLSTPAGVAVDPRGYVYVAEEASDVKVLAPTGRIVRHWGSKGRDPGQFMHALGIALDPKGDIYVASKLDGRFQEFSPDGRVLAIWPVHPHGDATPPPLPSGIAVALRGAIYTLEGWCSIRVRKRTPRGQVVATWRLS
jgi:DNA-binding beta-propeller fold protein YncE